MKLRIAFLMAVLLMISVLPTSAANNELHWYCKRNRDHKQAIVPELDFISEYGGYYIDRQHNENNEDKVVYLTFDVGYENGNVKKILDTMADKTVTGAFFVLKHFVLKDHDLVCRMMEEGHLVCNHTANHPNLSGATGEKVREELQLLEKVVLETTGRPCAPYFRPPEGSFSIDLLREVSALGYRTVFWSFAYEDWREDAQPEPEKALEKILSNMHNGAVLLLHPTSATNAEILPHLIDTLQAEGYRFGSLDELCEKP